MTDSSLPAEPENLPEDRPTQPANHCAQPDAPTDVQQPIAVASTGMPAPWYRKPRLLIGIGTALAAVTAGGVVIALSSLGATPTSATTSGPKSVQAPSNEALPQSKARAGSGPTPAIGEPDLAGKSVFLDPGHSGSNDSSISRQVPNGRDGTKDCQTTGTSTNSGYAEHTFNWDVVMRIREKLESMGIQTQLSRPDDTGLGSCIDQRAAEANAMQPDAIVSIHADGGPDWGQGFHIIYSAPPLNDAQTYASVDFAKLMRDTLRSRGLQESNYIGSEGLIGRADLAGLNIYAYPGILVELGNMRNADEAAKMESPKGREDYAAAVVDGIVEYLHQSESANTSTGNQVPSLNTPTPPSASNFGEAVSEPPR